MQELQCLRLAKLRQAEAFMAQGHARIEVARALGMMEALRQNGQSRVPAGRLTEPARVEELQTENARLRKKIADLILEKRILRELAKGNW
jgi:putative transposase